MMMTLTRLLLNGPFPASFWIFFTFSWYIMFTSIMAIGKKEWNKERKTEWVWHIFVKPLLGKPIPSKNRLASSEKSQSSTQHSNSVRWYRKSLFYRCATSAATNWLSTKWTFDSVGLCFVQAWLSFVFTILLQPQNRSDLTRSETDQLSCQNGSTALWNETKEHPTLENPLETSPTAAKIGWLIKRKVHLVFSESRQLRLDPLLIRLNRDNFLVHSWPVVWYKTDQIIWIFGQSGFSSSRWRDAPA